MKRDDDKPLLSTRRIAEMRDWDFEFNFSRRIRSRSILLLWDNTKRLSKVIYFVANDAFFSYID